MWLPRKQPCVPLAEGIREVAARHGALWLDAREMFGSEPRPWELYHPYDGHLNAAGHAAIAEALVLDLAPRVLAPTRSRRLPSAQSRSPALDTVR